MKKEVGVRWLRREPASLKPATVPGLVSDPIDLQLNLWSLKQYYHDASEVRTYKIIMVCACVIDHSYL